MNFNAILKSIFKILNIPINVFGNSNSNDNSNKIDASLFVQKPYLRTNFRESNIEEVIDLKSHYRIKKLPDLISIREAASKIMLIIISTILVYYKTLHI